jgi:hypothetical protein
MMAAIGTGYWLRGRRGLLVFGIALGCAGQDETVQGPPDDVGADVTAQGGAIAQDGVAPKDVADAVVADAKADAVTDPGGPSDAQPDPGPKPDGGNEADAAQDADAFASGFAPDGAQLCLNSAECPDSTVECKVFVCTKAKTCALVDAPEEAACDDGDPCTLLGKCSVGVCYKGPKVVCDDGKLCTTDACDPKTGCTYTANTVPCNDGDTCTVNDACEGGVCAPGGPKDCSDGNLCTSDSCDSKSGCGHKPKSGECDDGSACTQGDTCAFGYCQGGKGLECGDGNVCTLDGCDPKVGCTHTSATTACNDANACTEGDKCIDSACAGGPKKSCDDGEACTDDSCDPKLGCVWLPTAATCTDGNACTSGDACKGGFCKPASATQCDDGNPCTTDSCNPKSGCVATPNNQPCNDGDACTGTDACEGGACKGGPAVGCNDGNPCTDDSCDVKTGCVSVNNSVPCSDGNACTLEDGCKGGICQPGKAPECEDTNPCTTATCDPGEGCKNVNNTLTCNDGDACTKGDACSGGSCQPGKAVVCEDKNPCTDDACDVKTGCTNKANTVPCNDGNACTSGDQCAGGACKVGTTVACDDKNACTTDSCDPVKGCLKSNNTLSCDDGNACTVGDKCAFGKCNPGAPLPCQDGNVCTEDACNPATGCVFLPAQVTCNDGDACTGPDVCDSKVGCGGPKIACDDKNACTIDYCDNQKGCQSVANAVSCDDGSVCTTGDTCQGGECKGNAIACDDGNPCTQDACDAKGGCQYKALGDGTVCGGTGVCKSGICSIGSQTNPALHCAQILQAVPGASDGSYWLDSDGNGPGKAHETLCDMTHAGGGWTLVVNVADDSQHNWTWNKRLLWSTDKTVFGKASEATKDFKSVALHDVPFADVLFVHAPSGQWAVYKGVGTGKSSLANVIAVTSGPVCWQPSQGWPVSEGTLAMGGNLCSTKLYLNCGDHDGQQVCGDDDYTWGPCWSAKNNNTCPFDDPGQVSALGPWFASPNQEAPSLAWGAAQELNKGQAGSGQNHVTVWVR